MDEFPWTIPETEHAQGIVREEECHTRLAIEHRPALIALGCWKASQVQHRWSGVDEAHDLLTANLVRNHSCRGEEKRNADILVVKLKSVAKIALVPAEGFAVISQDDPKSLPVEASRTETTNERAQGCITVVKGVTVPPKFVVVRKWTWFRRLIRMVAGDRQIGHEERLTRRQRIDPTQNACHC